MATGVGISRLRLVIMLCLLMLSARHGTGAETSLSLVVSDANPVYANASGTGILDALVKELFARLGLSARVTRLPSERALLLAEQGEADGDIFRIAGLEKKFASLVMVPEPWLAMRFVAFATREEITIDSWEDLPPWRVAFIRGWQVFERHLAKAPALVRTDDALQLFELLKRQRVDVILYDDRQGEYFKRALDLPQARIAGPPLAKSPIFAYLHRKHAGLAPRMAKELRRMKQDGTWQRIINEDRRGTE
ncbi:MAG: transporter substrate-binding domain-containing protein [Magnetococcales bacterium]|nr:transporter substrate-binding domain-containing protein [Magnetococcales bacterium]